MKQHVIEKGHQPFIVFETSHLDEEGYEVTDTHELPATYEVCGHCNGTGTSSTYLGSWTADEWSQESYEFREEYLSGMYDQECPECRGKRVVAVPLEHPYTKEYGLFLSILQEDAEYEAMCRAERRMMGEC